MTVIIPHKASPVKHFLQYFNVEKMGRFPNGADALAARELGVFTKFAGAPDTVGHTVFVIAGLGKPKTYFLWETFTVAEVTSDGTQFTVSGPGKVLKPPALLQGADFDAFKNACANFVTFRAIDELPYLATLRAIASATGDAITLACEAFCDQLVALLPKHGDTYFYRATVRKRLGNADGAKADFAKAVELGTNFAAEAVESPAPTKSPSATTKGVFAGSAPKRPANVAEGVWRGVLLRRGQEAFRQQLVQAYGGRCAVTNYGGEAALEVALLDGDPVAGPFELPNALLMRGDVRTLFDLNLIRIQPHSRVIVVAEALRNTNYFRLNGRRLRLPEEASQRPSREALAKRWEAGAS